MKSLIMITAQFVTISIILAGTPARSAPCGDNETQTASQDAGEAQLMSKREYSALPMSGSDANNAYQTYFGSYTDQRRQIVATTLSQVIGSLVIGNIQFMCLSNNDQFCA